MSELITERQAAEILGIKERTLRSWRTVRKIGPQAIKYEGRAGAVRYARVEVEAYLNNHRVGAENE